MTKIQIKVYVLTEDVKKCQIERVYCRMNNGLYGKRSRKKNTWIRYHIRNNMWIMAKKKSMGNQMEESQACLVYEKTYSVKRRERIL